MAYTGTPSTPGATHGLAAALGRYLEALGIKGYRPGGIATAARYIGEFMEWAQARGVSHPQQVSRAVLERYQKFLYHYRKKNGDGAWLAAGTAARGHQIANGMAADLSLGFSAFKWSDKDLILPLVNGDMQNGRVASLETNVLSRAVGTRYALAPMAAPSWLSNQLGGVTPVPSGGALHSMATSVMYGLFGTVGRR